MLSDKVAKCVIHSGSIGSRIAYVEINAHPCNLFIIGVYVPHSNRKQSPFAADISAELDILLSNISHHTCTIMSGDLNCKLGRNIEKLTGKWCIHKKPNIAGQNFVEMMRKHHLSAVSTFFKPVKRRNSPSRSNATNISCQRSPLQASSNRLHTYIVSLGNIGAGLQGQMGYFLSTMGQTL